MASTAPRISDTAFEALKITTMTLILICSGTINLDTAFTLLPITVIDLPTPKRHAQKFKIPHCPIPGSILSLRYKGYTRGIIRSTSSKYFKNSVTIDVSCIQKNVSIKLSAGKMQMCGPNSVAQALEGASYIINNLLAIQDELDYCCNNPNKVRATIEWLKNNMRGTSILREGTPDYTVGTGCKFPTEAVDFDERIANFYLKHGKDFEYYSDWCADIDWLKEQTSVCSRPLEVVEVQKAMVNYNYDLGFQVSRQELARRIKGMNGFFSRYINAIEHNVSIELPYEVTDENKKMRKRAKRPCHTFLVYKSGLVTQSGPGEELMKDAYNLFKRTIMELRPFITKSLSRRSLKYVPHWHTDEDSTTEMSKSSEL